MIRSIAIENIALIDHVEIELTEGLNILSGETGGGKSIIIDSINFVLGERADRSLIRHGKDRASVEVVFETVAGSMAEKYLESIGFEVDGTVIVTRTMTENGKSECRINRKICNLQTLRELVGLLVDLHAQHEHQSLMNQSTHIHILDGYAGLEDDLKTYEEVYRNLKDTKAQIDRFSSLEERERKLDILNFQINEINNANLKEGEEENLLALRTKLNNYERIASATSGAVNILDGDSDSGVIRVAQAINYLTNIAQYDDSLNDLIARLDSVKIELADIAETLKDGLDVSEYDFSSLEKVEKRIQEIRSLKRKYGNGIQEILAFLNNCIEEKTTLENAEIELEKLEKQYKKTLEKLVDLAEKLHDKRAKASKTFEKRIVSNLIDLGMVNSKFEVNITKTTDVESYTKIGCDTVEFLISANLGEPLKPLSKIASGGELSRFMLGLKNIIADIDGIDTLIFDEIDTGISGNIAKVVGEKLYSIGSKRQVIAVTHLAQIASMADTHFLIEKSSDSEKTTTSVTKLAEDEALVELIRLTGGDVNSNVSKEHAKELSTWAKNIKSKF